MFASRHLYACNYTLLLLLLLVVYTYESINFTQFTHSSTHAVLDTQDVGHARAEDASDERRRDAR